MARSVAALPEGSRITDYISLGVITKIFPMSKIRSVLSDTGKARWCRSLRRCCSWVSAGGAAVARSM